MTLCVSQCGLTAGFGASTWLRAYRAAQLLKSETGCALGVDIEIEKCIPAGGGLGGGSSDAATVLLALNRLWNLGLTRAHLMQLGLKLGADVPFFIFGRNAFATGVGEELQGVELPSRSFVVIKPQVEVPTAAIFGSPELTRNAKSVKIVDFSAGVLTGRLAGGQNASQTSQQSRSQTRSQSRSQTSQSLSQTRSETLEQA